MTGDNYPIEIYFCELLYTASTHTHRQTNVRKTEPCNADVNSSLRDVQMGHHDGTDRPRQKTPKKREKRQEMETEKNV